MELVDLTNGVADNDLAVSIQAILDQNDIDTLFVSGDAGDDVFAPGEFAPGTRGADVVLGGEI